MKNEKKERELLLEDFKSLGLKNKRLEDELKGRKGNPSKRIKPTKNAQKSSKKLAKTNRRTAEVDQVLEREHSRA